MTAARVPEYMQLLPADVLARFAQGRFRARNLVEGFKSGDHRSPYLGTSTEFAEHREYSPGDDPRTLDWRVFGKLDRYCVRQYVAETNLRATILLDGSASMGFVGDLASRRNGRQLGKLAYAHHLAAMLAYLFIRQGDAIGLVSFDAAVRTFIPAGCKPSTLRRILQTLDQARPGDESNTAAVIHEVAERIPPRGVVILLGDFLDEVPELVKALYHLAHRKHEIVLFQVLAEEELTFPFTGAARFSDLEELTETMDVAPDAIRTEYVRQINAHLSELEKGCRQLRADYVRFNTRTPYEETLAAYLARRMGGK